MQYLKIDKIVHTISVTHKFDKNYLLAINTSDVDNGVMGKGILTPTSKLKGQFKKTIQKDDILFSEIRPANRRFARVTEENCENFVVSTKLMVLRKFNEDVDLDYFYYCLTNQSFLDILQRRAENRIGSFPQITFDLLSEYSFPIPSLQEQRNIAKCIANLDKKISLNRAINQNLEALAKQLYDYWFVQFDFPDENGRPYKSSGGKMVWNEKLKKNIPNNWNDCELNRYIGRVTNGLNPRKNFVLGNGDNYYVTIRSLVGTDIDWDNCDRCDNDALEKINNRSQLQVGDVIFSAIGTIGRTYFIQETPDNWNISETSFTLRASDGIDPFFFYSLLCSEEIQKNADKNAMGSTLRCLVMDSLCKISTIDIDIMTINKYAQIVTPIYKYIYEVNKQTRQLIKQRNELLPLLMNGQVSLNSDLCTVK